MAGSYLDEREGLRNYITALKTFFNFFILIYCHCVSVSKIDYYIIRPNVQSKIFRFTHVHDCIKINVLQYYYD